MSLDFIRRAECPERVDGLNRSRDTCSEKRGRRSSGKQASCLEIEGPRTHPRQEPPMTDKAISPLRRRLIEDMAIRRLGPKTQHHYIHHVKRFADFLGQSADKATAEDVHRYQLWLASIGTTVPTVNVSATALRCVVKVTRERRAPGDADVAVC